DAASGKASRRLAGHRTEPLGTAFSPDSKLLASAAPDGARLWDVATGWQIGHFRGPAKGFVAVAFSPDGQSMALATPEQTIELRDVWTGADRGNLEAPANNLAYRADGRLLISSGPDNVLRTWNVIGTVADRGIALPMPQKIHALALTPEGRYV